MFFFIITGTNSLSTCTETLRQMKGGVNAYDVVAELFSINYEIVDIERSCRCDIMSLDQRQEIVMAGPAGKKGVARPFEKFHKKEL